MHWKPTLFGRFRNGDGPRNKRFRRGAPMDESIRVYQRIALDRNMAQTNTAADGKETNEERKCAENDKDEEVLPVGTVVGGIDV